MATACTRIDLGAIVLVLLFLPYLFSSADFIYHPYEISSINCGSSTNIFTPDGRNWTSDINFLSEKLDSDVTTITQPSQPAPYSSARFSHTQFTYSFPLSPGPKFLRFFFSSDSYQNFDPSTALFTVKSGPYTLLQNVNPLNADDKANYQIVLEYCIYHRDGERLNVTFIPNATDSYAFINGIEIVSMPPYLYYTNSTIDHTELPQLLGGSSTYPIETNTALETKYRLNVGGSEIQSSGDTGMLRTWEPDDDYLHSLKVGSSDIENRIKLNFNKTSNYTAPDEVYRSVRNMGSNGSINMGFNLTWILPVDPGFTYMLRLHFCELDPTVNQTGDLIFYVYIQDQLVEDWVDVLAWSHNQKGVPVVREYAIIIPGNEENANVSLKMHPHPNSRIKDAQLNAIELFKLNDTTGNLAGPNPQPFQRSPTIRGEDTNKKSRGTKRTFFAAVGGAVSGVLLFCLILAFFVTKRRGKKNVPVHNGGSSSLPTNICRRFSIAEIVAATNNFDEHFMVGKGGFGNVYKGYIDEGTTCVAIKRLKPGSQQGVHEFVNEIEMLSQLRHIHLVSLIGYCYESNEMILVYDFMDRGTLNDHLYGTDNNPPLSWKQRLEICIGAARGLHYLHTGAKRMIIHRDVKSTNILLDQKWVAKVSDFGLSRIGPTGSSMTHVSTQVKGSVGYIHPEYYKRQRLTEKSDVYSFGVVLLEVLSGRQPLLRKAAKQQVSLVDWARHCCQKGSLDEILDPTLKGQIAPVCARKFSEVALNCLLEDGTQRPSMNNVVGMLEFVLQLQGSSVDGVMESGGNYEDSDDIFSTSQSSIHVSDDSKSSGLSITKDGDRSYVSKESERFIPQHVFSEIEDPKGR